MFRNILTWIKLNLSAIVMTPSLLLIIFSLIYLNFFKKNDYLNKLIPLEIMIELSYWNIIWITVLGVLYLITLKNKKHES